jgi:hypothetical protein
MGADQSREETEGSDHAANKMKSPERSNLLAISAFPIKTKAWRDANCRAAADLVAIRSAVALRPGRREGFNG